MPEVEQNSHFFTTALLFQGTLHYTPSSQPHRRELQAFLVFSVPCYPQLLCHCFYSTVQDFLRVELFYVCTVRDSHMNECQNRCWCDWGTELLFLSKLPCVTGGNHTEPLSHAFTSLVPADHSSSKCIHARQRPSAGFQADFFSTWTTFCFPDLFPWTINGSH